MDFEIRTETSRRLVNAEKAHRRESEPSGNWGTICPLLGLLAVGVRLNLKRFIYSMIHSAIPAYKYWFYTTYSVII